MAQSNATSPSLLDRAKAWIEEEPDLNLDNEGTLLVDGDPPVKIELSEADDRLTLSHLGTSASGATPERGSRVRVHRGDGDAVVLSIAVYADGFSRQSFVEAIGALVRAVDATSGAPAAEAAPAAEPATAAETAPVAAAATAPEPAASVAEPAPTREIPAAWVPTHAVPAGGTRAWANPDPTPDPVATLEPRVRLSIAERRGDWARVIGSNGWTGWVDARVLEPLGAQGQLPPARTAGGFAIGGMKIRVLPAVATIALALSAFLPWAVGYPKPAAPIDIPVQILINPNSAPSGIGSMDLIWLLLILTALAAVITFTRAPAVVAILVGLIALAVAFGFAAQLYRIYSDNGAGFSDFIHALKLTPLLTVAGGVLLISGARVR